MILPKDSKFWRRNRKQYLPELTGAVLSKLNSQEPSKKQKKLKSYTVKFMNLKTGYR